MIRLNLLPVLRRRGAWIALALAVLLLLLSVAWMDMTAAQNRAEIDRVYDEMEVHFLLNAGRRSLSSGFRIRLVALREIEHMEYFENFGSNSLSLPVMLDERRFGEQMSVFWTPDPEKAGIRAEEGALEEGIWLPRETARKLGLKVGDTLTVYTPMAGIGGGGKKAKEVPVAAITGASAAYMPEESFDGLLEWVYMSGSPDFFMNDVHFDLKKEYNKRLSEVESKLQALVNTPNPQDRNRDVSVNYNASEIDGMLKPLEKSADSAEFFGKLFRAALPAVAYLIEIIALFGLRNEVGVRRFFGEKPGAVFLGIWLPVFLLSLPGYLLSALLLLTPLGPFLPWSMALWHLAGTSVLTALLTGLLCALSPLLLLREKEHE